MKRKTFQIPGMIQVGKKHGMQTLDDAIMDLLNKKMISPEEAYGRCLDKNKFRLAAARIRLRSGSK